MLPALAACGKFWCACSGIKKIISRETGSDLSKLEMQAKNQIFPGFQYHRGAGYCGWGQPEGAGVAGNYKRKQKQTQGK
ncbi:MAG: hypothetical protein R2875_03420 [Desulfobacterales bacterium]